jgi:hypothetical protein
MLTAGATSGTITATAGNVSSSSVAVIKASCGETTRTATIGILAPPPAPKPSTPNAELIRGDFDGDDKPDLIWQDKNTRQVAVWYMGGALGNQFLSFGWLAGAGTPGWSVATVADLDRNGKPDLVWQNMITRQVRVSYMGGAKGDRHQSTAWLQNSDLPGWSIAGAADLDGNGAPDLIWQEDATRRVAVWYMGGPQGNQLQYFAWLQASSTPGWSVVGMADLDGNSKPDLIWQNDSTRQVIVWYMGGADGGQFQSLAWLQTSNTPGWTVIGLVDLDKNGRPDLVWQNDATGQVAVWYMGGGDGSHFQSFGWLESNGITGWRAMAAR